MENREERQQLEEIRALLKRAERTPNRSSAVRKDTLQRLIELAHSPYSSLKSLAAINFRFFIKDFPELEDDAINAVYDLCEDPAAKVRIEGYVAIVSVSKEQKKWVKRNADVLVQLLQSDEPEEVVVVKKSLIEHLDMDPVVTLGVLCDQITPLEDPVDDEEQVTRDRLRSLVLAFLTGEAYRAITERHANAPGSPAEDVLISGLLKAIPKLPHTDVGIAVKGLLLSLPSFSKPSSRGDELLEVVLGVAALWLKAELPSGATCTPLSNTMHFLELAAFVSTIQGVANPKPLLQFHCTSLAPNLVELTEDTQALVLSHIADSFVACEQTKGITAEELSTLRSQVIDACNSLLPCFNEIKSEGKRPWRACCILLKSCKRRKDELGWNPPPPLAEALRKIQHLAEIELEQGASTDKASIEEAQSLIRPLLSPPGATSKPSTTPPSSANDTKGISSKNKPNTSPVIIQRNREDRSRSTTTPAKPSTLPPKPPPSSIGEDTNGTSSDTRADRQRQSIGSIPAQVARQLGTVTSNSTLDKPTLSSTRARSVIRTGSQNDGTPSLLSRLSSNASAADTSSSRPSTTSIPAKRRAEPEKTPSRRPSPPGQSKDIDVDMDPVEGYSIRGAAKAVNRPQPAKDAPLVRTSSLLDRLKGDGDAQERRGKKRTRNF